MHDACISVHFSNAGDVDVDGGRWGFMQLRITHSDHKEKPSSQQIRMKKKNYNQYWNLYIANDCMMPNVRETQKIHQNHSSMQETSLRWYAMRIFIPIELPPEYILLCVCVCSQPSTK